MVVNGNHLSKYSIYNINVIALIIVTICTSLVSFFATLLYYKIIFTMLLVLLLIFLGYAKQAIKFALLYCVVFIWFMINLEYTIKIPSPMLFTFLITIIPIIMSAYMIIQVPLGKTTTALRQLKIPETVILAVIVTLRFVPTTLAEIKDVKNAMRVRGFLSPLNVLRHPIKTFEYAVVPLIFCSLKIADELAASCIARGIESPKKKTGYYINKTRLSDIILVVVFSGVTILFLI